MLVVLLVIVPISVYALVSSYSSVAVPAACTGAAATVTAAHRVAVPGLGDGTLVATDGQTEVVAVPGLGGLTAGGTAAVLVNGAVVASLPIASRTVDAGIDDGVLFLFDDTIGFTLDPTTGQPLPRILESDNYRGLFTSGRGRTRPDEHRGHRHRYGRAPVHDGDAPVRRRCRRLSAGRAGRRVTARIRGSASLCA